MKIKWLGHSSFLLTSDAGTRIFMDPYDERAGYELPSVEADIVTTSHNHGDHNHMQNAKGEYVHLSQPGEYDIKGIKIHGINVFHDEVEGAKRGNVVLFVFSIDGLNICHCGDIGHVPDAESAKKIGKIDVLLIPVGSVYTIDAQQAKEVMGILKPSITIPMHFKTDVVKFPIEGVEKFLDLTAGKKIGVQEIVLNKNNLNTFPNVIVLEYR